MTDEELQKSRANLGALVTELRRFDGALADRLIDAVQYSSTSGEIYASVGESRHRMCRRGIESWLTSLFRKHK